jgi:hypothetical protein
MPDGPARTFDPGYGHEPFRTPCDDAPGRDVYPSADFRVEWEPVFHRGRLDGTARLRRPVAAYDLPAGVPRWMGAGSGWAERQGATPRLRRRTIAITVPAGEVPA